MAVTHVGTRVLCVACVALIAACAAANNGDVAAHAADDGATTLLVSGRISADSATLDPAFLVDARAVLPATGESAHRLSGFDANNDPIFEVRFDGTAVADAAPGAMHFTWAVPLDSSAAARLYRLDLETAGGTRVVRIAGTRATPMQVAPAAFAVDHLDGGRVRLRWDATSLPQVLVRDPATRQVLARGSGGAVTVLTALAEVEVLVSDGVRSTAVVVTVR
jgi:hypothetical protein